MKRFIRIFLAGLVALLPLAITVLATIWVVQLGREYVGPDSMVGRFLISLGMGVNADSVAPYLLGLVVVIAAIWLFGLLVITSIGPWLTGFLSGVIERIPLIGTVYGMSRKFVSLVDSPGGGALEGMSPVWCVFGGGTGARVLALLPDANTIDIHGVPHLGVLIPTAPVPVGGCLLYVPAAWVEQAEGGIDHLLSVYVSMGVTPPKVLADTAAAAIAAPKGPTP